MAAQRAFQRGIKSILAAFVTLSSAVLGDGVAQTPSGLTAPRGAEEPREQVWEVPYPRADVYMRTTVRLPGGKGPFPLVVINHGSSENAEVRKESASPSFDTVSSWFVERGSALQWFDHFLV